MNKRAVDFDGTLATYGGYKGPSNLGKPIGPMMTKVFQWIREGDEVIIFTARDKEAWPYIQRWLHKYGLYNIKITNIKTFDITHFYDDRAYRVEYNTGRICDCIKER